MAVGLRQCTLLAGVSWTPSARGGREAATGTWIPSRVVARCRLIGLIVAAWQQKQPSVPVEPWGITTEGMRYVKVPAATCRDVQCRMTAECGRKYQFSKKTMLKKNWNWLARNNDHSFFYFLLFCSTVISLFIYLLVSTMHPIKWFILSTRIYLQKHRIQCIKLYLASRWETLLCYSV